MGTGPGTLRTRGQWIDLGGPMMGRMLQHMDCVAQMPGDSLRAALTEHRRMVGNMINRMVEEMGRLTMGASRDWTRLLVSVRDDWSACPIG